MKIIKICFVFACLISLNACKEKSSTSSENKDTSITQYALNTGVNDGMQTEKYENGNKKFEGLMKNGKREGEWFMYFENGSIWSRCNYLEDKKQGKSIVYLPNGNKAYEGLYEEDKPVGEWIYYNNDGSISKKVTQK